MEDTHNANDKCTGEGHVGPHPVNSCKSTYRSWFVFCCVFPFLWNGIYVSCDCAHRELKRKFTEVKVVGGTRERDKSVFVHSYLLEVFNLGRSN